MLSAALALVRTGVGLAFNIALYLLWFRLVAHYIGLPQNQLMMKTVTSWTDYAVQPVASVVARLGRGKIEWPVLIVALLIDVVRFYVFGLWLAGIWIKPVVLLMLLIGDCFMFPLQLLFYAFLLRIVMGWLPISPDNALKNAVEGLTAPIMKYSRDWLPPIDGLDFLPFIWVLILKSLSFCIYIAMPFRL